MPPHRDIIRLQATAGTRPDPQPGSEHQQLHPTLMTIAFYMFLYCIDISFTECWNRGCGTPTRMAASSRPGRWIKGDTSEKSLQKFDRWIIAYQAWPSKCLNSEDQQLTEPQKWVILSAIGGTDLHDIIRKAGIIPTDRAKRNPPPMAVGILWIRATIPYWHPTSNAGTPLEQ